MSDPLESPGLTDIHAHPLLNAYLFDRDLRRHYHSGGAFNPLSSLSDFVMLREGDVRVLWSTLYVPERDLFDCRLLWALAHFTGGGRKLLKLSYWKCLLDMAQCMERQVRSTCGEFEIARSNADLDDIVRSGKRAIVQTVEGGHILEGRLDRLDVLAEMGVASFALAHLFPNDLVGHSEGIPEDIREFPVCPIDTGVVHSRGLTPFGEDVVERLVQLRIVPDLTHCTATARREVLRIVDGRVPVIASHTGVKALNPVDYNLSDMEIRAIAETGGVVGVIFMPYWLRRDHPRDGLEAIWQTMEHVAAITGSWGSVAIGTDFDGFTDPPDDAFDASHLPLIGRMLGDKGLADAEVGAVLGGNARRVLRKGWR